MKNGPYHWFPCLFLCSFPKLFCQFRAIIELFCHNFGSILVKNVFRRGWICRCLQRTGLTFPKVWNLQNQVLTACSLSQSELNRKWAV